VSSRPSPIGTPHGRQSNITRRGRSPVGATPCRRHNVGPAPTVGEDLRVLPSIPNRDTPRTPIQYHSPRPITRRGDPLSPSQRGSRAHRRGGPTCPPVHPQSGHPTDTNTILPTQVDHQWTPCSCLSSFRTIGLHPIPSGRSPVAVTTWVTRPL
jgi:hypothetical protein